MIYFYFVFLSIYIIQFYALIRPVHNCILGSLHFAAFQFSFSVDLFCLHLLRFALAISSNALLRFNVIEKDLLQLFAYELVLFCSDCLLNWS